MDDIVRRIRKTGKITSTADWQLNRLLILGKSSSDLKKIVSSAVQYNDAEVEKLYEAVIADEYTRYKPQYEEINHSFIPYEDNYELQQITEAMIKQTEGELTNITKSMGFMLDYGGDRGLVYTPLSQIYNEYLDQAMVDLTSGAFDYNTLIRRTVDQLTRSGLRTDHAFSVNSDDYTGIDYPSGWHNRIDVAARRAILTGVSQLSGRIMDMNAESLGVDKFEVSWHVGARPDHAAWQGKVYTRKGLEDICGLGTGAGLLGWNCRHEYYLFFPGSERLYTDEWLEEQNAKEAQKKSFRGKEYNTYEATQKQRQLETNMRAQREKVRLLQTAGADPDEITIERCKYQAQLDEYKAFSKAMKIPQQRERIYYDLKGRVAPSQATMAKYTPEMMRRATIDNNMYSRRKEVLGDEMPTLGDFRQMKYREPDKYDALNRQYATYKEIAAKPWEQEAKDRAISAYRDFKKAGHETSSHFLARYIDRGGGDTSPIIELMNKPPNYKQVDGREVRLYNGYALIKNPDTNEYVTIERKATPKDEWVAL